MLRRLYSSDAVRKSASGIASAALRADSKFIAELGTATRATRATEAVQASMPSSRSFVERNTLELPPCPIIYSDARQGERQGSLQRRNVPFIAIKQA